METTPLAGEFNTNVFVLADGRAALMRIPRRNDSMLASIFHEYRAIGFVADGGRVKRRTPEEQYAFSRQAAMERLRVLPPLSFDSSKKIYYPLLPHAQTLDVFMQDAAEEDRSRVIHQLVDDLHAAHTRNRVYGDRWAGNMLVDRKFGLLHIDFDIELLGPHAHELEVAQVTYHTLWSGRSSVVPTLAHILFLYQYGWFELSRTTRYLRGLARYFSQTKVGGVEDDVEMLIDLIQSQRHHEVAP